MTNCSIRARGFSIGGYCNSSGALVESIGGVPFIVNQPASQQALPGTNINFSVTAGGTPVLGYQWRKDGTNLSSGARYLGVNASTLTVSNLLRADAGGYTVVITNNFGAVTSAVAALQIVNSVTNEPINPPFSSGMVFSAVPQPDNRILASWGSKGAVRLNPNGSLDSSFSTSIQYNEIYAMLQQPDGMVVLGGPFANLNNSSYSYLGRVYADGTLDTNFHPRFFGYGGPRCLGIQPDAKILVGGSFTNLTGLTCNRIGRLNPDGTLDSSFNGGVGGSSSATVYALALQPDDKIVVGGSFSILGGVAQVNLGRFNPDGSPDTNFNPVVSGQVYCLAIQPDGKILVGGDISWLAGQGRSHLGRLNADGTLDVSFNPGADDTVYSLVLQTDGKMLVGGAFTNLAGQVSPCLGRLLSDGTLDPTFRATANSDVSSLALQADGKVLVGGTFGILAGVMGYPLARLSNTEPATQNLTMTDSTITWMRGSTGPEILSASFEYTTNDKDWVSVGAGSRIPGGWRLSGLSLPAGVNIRARGFSTGGYYNGSAWPVESSMRPVISAVGFRTNKFGFNLSGIGSQTVVVQASTNLTDWATLTVKPLTNGFLYINDPASPGYPQRFYRVRLQ
jgi:uncharacterized delta-60 repeat protein